MSRGSAAFGRRRGHLAVVSRAVVTVVSRQLWLSRESWLPFNSRVSQAEYKGHPTNKNQNPENGFPRWGYLTDSNHFVNKSES